MTGESRLADLQCVYQFTHAQFPAPESSNNANACRIYDSLPKGGKVSHYLLYIGICRYIKRDVNHEKDNADRLWRITWSWDDDAGKGCGARVGGCLSVRSQNSSGRLRLNGTVQGRAGKRKIDQRITQNNFQSDCHFANYLAQLFARYLAYRCLPKSDFWTRSVRSPA